MYAMPFQQRRIVVQGKIEFFRVDSVFTTKQKERAEKMYSVLKKEKMPPKSARETRPDIIPSRDQVDTIKKWAESLKGDNK